MDGSYGARQWKDLHPEAFEEESSFHTIRNVAKTGSSAVQLLRALPLMAKRILGLYDVLLLMKSGKMEELPALTIVEPNIRRISDERKLDYDTLLLTVVLHEDIHNRQFYKSGNMSARRMELIKENITLTMMESWPPLKGVDKKTITDRKKVLDDEITCLMSVVEGHADYYAAKATREILGDEAVDAYDRSLEASKNSFSSKMKKLWFKASRHPMLEKMSQYVDGVAFVEAVDEAMGDGASQFVMDNVPVSIKELKQPSLYIERHKLSE